MFSMEQMMMQLSAVSRTTSISYSFQDRLFDQNLFDRRGAQAPGDDLLELLRVVGDAAARAAEREGGPDDRRQADGLQCFQRRFIGIDQARGRGLEADLVHRLAEELAVLGLLDDVGVGADQLHAKALQGAVALQRQTGVERGLAAHGGQERVGPFLFDDLGDHLRGDRLDVGGVRQVRVGHDGGGVGVHQDHPVALLAQGLAGLGPGIVELAGLADHDGTGADDQDRVDVVTLWHRFFNLAFFPVLGRSFWSGL
jgi:hypothetical protein